MAVNVPTPLPLSEHHVNMIRLHVPESVLSQLGNWSERIPVVECVMRRTAITQVPDTLVRKLFFMHQFEDSRSTEENPSIVEGVALAFFHKIEIATYRGIEGARCARWELHTCAFENSQPRGFYEFQVNAVNQITWIGKDELIDAHTPSWDPVSSPQSILDQKVPRLLELGDQFRELESLPPDPIVIDMPPQAQPVEARPWYLRIFDALSGCLSGLFDCIWRLFSAQRVER